MVVLDLFRPYIAEKEQHGFRNYVAEKSSPRTIFAASVVQLKCKYKSSKDWHYSNDKLSVTVHVCDRVYASLLESCAERSHCVHCERCSQ